MCGDATVCAGSVVVACGGGVVTWPPLLMGVVR